MVAGTRSGAGKTTVTLGLMAAFKRRGLDVAPFKVGPDFIDPGHHARVTGRASRNLDGWMLGKETNLDLFHRRAAGAQVAVIEGVMGLFDGCSGRSEDGSTAQMAKWLGIPVLLVADAGSMAGSAAAMIMGFEQFDPQLNFAGVLFNHLGSRGHFNYLREALADHVVMPCLGGIVRRREVRIPERHLGLVTGEDHPMTTALQNKLADLVEEAIDLDALLRRLPEIPVFQKARPNFSVSAEKPGVAIAVAKDNAFCFYYRENLELIEQCGADITYFSPVAGDPLPAGICGLYLGGGYPELFAEALSRNQVLRDQIRQASHDGMPIYAECGGFMYLCRRISDHQGHIFDMCGCFDFNTGMFQRLRSLGYREVRLQQKSILGPAGTRIRGHEFHYSDIAGKDTRARRVYHVSDRSGNACSREGFYINNTLGSYFHLHFASCPAAARAFVDSCKRFHKGIWHDETPRN